jgi:hypothetical protein
MDPIEPALRALWDEREIVGCLHRYSRGIDRCDIALVESCFYSDALQDSGFYVGSPRGWAELVTKFHLKECVCQQHHLTNHNVELDGDVAHVESYYLAVVREKRGTTTFASGRWVDRFERRDDVWRIALRISTTESITDVPTSDMTQADARFVPWTRDRTDLSYERPLMPLRTSKTEPFRSIG